VWTPLRAIDLKHLRQIRTLRAARIIHIAGGFLRAIGGQLIEPIDHLGITAAGMGSLTHLWNFGGERGQRARYYNGDS
jgi:hypothetical protein